MVNDHRGDRGHLRAQRDRERGHRRRAQLGARQQDHALRQDDVVERLGVKVGPHVQHQVVAHLISNARLRSEIGKGEFRGVVYLGASRRSEHFDVLVSDGELGEREELGACLGPVAVLVVGDEPEGADVVHEVLDPLVAGADVGPGGQLRPEIDVHLPDARPVGQLLDDARLEHPRGGRAELHRRTDEHPVVAQPLLRQGGSVMERDGELESHQMFVQLVASTASIIFSLT